MENILTILRSNNIHLALDQQYNLSVEAPKGALTPDIVDLIRSNKADLVNYLRQLHTSQGAARIPRVDEQEKYPVSPSQFRLWVLSRIDGGSKAYNISQAIRLNGEIDPEQMLAAMNDLVSRHEVLRTVFFQDEQGTVWQKVRPAGESGFVPEFIDLLDGVSTKEQAEQIIQAAPGHEFDLEQGPLLKAVWIRHDAGTHSLVYVMHHIISDGWSMGVIERELMALYAARKSGKTNPLPELPIQYKDYTAWLLERIQGQEFSRLKNYWLEQFSGPLPVLNTGTVLKRPAYKSFQGDNLAFRLEEAETERFRRMLDKEGATLFIGLLAAWNLLFYRTTGQDDIIIGTPVAGRDHPDLEGQIGFYANTLALRTKINGKSSVRDFIREVRKTTISAYEHQLYPFDQLVEDIQLKRDMSRSVLFDVMLVLQNFQMGQTAPSPDSATLSTANIEQKRGISQFDLNLNCIESQGGVQIDIEYSTEVLTTAEIQRMAARFKKLVMEMAASPDKPLNEIEVLPVEEQQLIRGFITQGGKPATAETIVALYEQQVLAHSDDPAVVSGDRSISFSEFDRKVNQLAARLSGQKIGPGHVVAIAHPVSVEFLQSVMAVLKTGAAFLPVDPDYPKTRIEYMLSDAGVSAILAHAATGDLLESSGNKLHWLDREAPADVDVKFTSAARAEERAYIIYTSGSTGKPKGVQITHSALSNYLTWADSYYFTKGEETCFALFTSPAFDLTITSIFSGLMRGRPVYVPASAGNIFAAVKEIFAADSPVTVVKMTPAHVLVLEAAGIRQIPTTRIILGGEALLNAHVRTLRKANPSVRIYNEYGPTEATVGCCIEEITDADQFIHIGRPISGTTIEIVDAGGMRCGVGMPGELCIGGAGLSMGYFNRPALNEEKFTKGRSGETIYHTGDLACWLEDGNLQLIGRIDDQVKYRGYRIELGEIEKAVSAVMSNERVVVNPVHPANQDMQLALYYTGEEEWTLVRLRNALESLLPAYMIPSLVVRIESIPLSPNGKVDRKALPVPEKEAGGHQKKEPARTAEEKLMAEIWRDMFREEVGVNDNFFELGGDSIKAIQVASRLRSRGYHLTVSDLLRSASLASAAVKIKLLERQADQGPAQGEWPVTPVQNWFLAGPNARAGHYNQSVILRLRGKADTGKLKKALERLVQHHDALRLSFREKDGTWLQVYEDGNRFVLHEFDLGNSSDIAGDIDRLSDSVQQQISLDSGSLFHAAVFGCPDEDRVLLVLHHLVTDGVSWRILLEDLNRLYAASDPGKSDLLPPKTDALGYWSAELEKMFSGQELETESAYWNNLAEGDIGAWSSANDTPSTYEGLANENISFGKDFTASMRKAGVQAYAVQARDLLVTALSHALRSGFGGSNTVLFLEGHGRDEIVPLTDISRTVGWFTSIYPVKLNKPETGAGLVGELLTVKETLRSVPHNGLGYLLLKKQRPDHPAFARLPKQVIFNFLGEFGEQEDNTESRLILSGDRKGKDIGPQITREFEIEVTGIIVSDELHVSISYHPEHYAPQLIAEMAAGFRNALEELVQQCVEGSRLKTPSDLTWKKISMEQLIRLQKEVAVEDIYPMSPLQGGIYFHSIKDREQLVYFEQSRVDIGGASVDLLKTAYASLVDRNPAIRTVFREIEGQVMQLVVHQQQADFRFTDISTMSAGEQEQFIEKFKQQDRQNYFSLSEGPLMRLSVLRRNGTTHTLIWSHHHLLMDGWCVSLLIAEFFDLYRSAAQQETYTKPPLAPFADYISWLSGQDMGTAYGYWNQYLAGYEKLTTLTPEKSPREYTEAIVKLDWTGEKHLAIESLARRLQVTSSVLLQSMWGVLLAKYNNVRDAVFGLVVSGRPSSLDGIEEMIGLFINTLPVRVRYDEQLPAEALIRRVQAQALEGSQYHFVQISEIQQARQLADILFDHIMVIENYPWQENVLSSGESNGLEIQKVEVFDRSNYDFMLVVSMTEGITIEFKYNSSSIDGGIIRKAAGHLDYLVDQLLANPQTRVSDLQLIPQVETDALQKNFQVPAVPLPEKANVLDVFKSTVALAARETAVSAPDGRLDYETLDRSSDEMAAALQLLGVGPGDPVLVKTPPGVRTLTVILGIWKAGGIYVPVDDKQPENRVTAIQEQVGSRLTLDITTLEIIDGMSADASMLVPVSPDPAQLAYIIHTSGSTGLPKGVCVTHANLSAHLALIRSYFGPGRADVPLMASPAFDISIFELMLPLATAGTLVIPDYDSLYDTSGLTALLEQVSVVQSVPAQWMKLLAVPSEQDRPHIFPNIRHVVTGGDAVPAQVLLELMKMAPGATINVMYGPTEATVFCTGISYLPGTEEKVISGDNIGRPLPGHEILIAGMDGDLLPPGFAGEILVGGAGVAQGYWSRDEQTASVFTAHPLRSGERVYRTGDYGMWMPDGTIRFLGRDDQQIKVNGFRIETGEIENALRKLPHIKQAAIKAFDIKNNQKELVAFVMSSVPVSNEELRRQLLQLLPAYMVPRFFVPVEDWPLSSNNKIDRSRLELPESLDISRSTEYVAPRNDIEQRLQKLWEDVLSVKEIGIRDNFFELGGDSLKVVRILAAISHEFGLKIQVDKIFDNPTIEQTAREIETLQWLQSANDPGTADSSDEDSETFEL